MRYIVFDTHKRYTQACVSSLTGAVQRETRVDHEPGAVPAFLRGFDPGSPVAVEAVGNWYWIVDEIEAAGMVPRLVHPRKAKMMMGMINKTDKLDARGMNRLQQNGTLPVVWIPPGDLRDERDLPRTRMILVQQRTRLKNRIHATLAKYALSPTGLSDAFGKRGQEVIRERIRSLPPETQFATERLMEELVLRRGKCRGVGVPDEGGIRGNSRDQAPNDPPRGRLHSRHRNRPGDRGSSTIPEASRLASYAGTTPRVHYSGGKTRFGTLRTDVNQYLKWAFVEAGNGICAHAAIGLVTRSPPLPENPGP